MNNVVLDKVATYSLSVEEHDIARSMLYDGIMEKDKYKLKEVATNVAEKWGEAARIEGKEDYANYLDYAISKDSRFFSFYEVVDNDEQELGQIIFFK